ncbi:hypothetical protein AMATHDRAFT_148990 [Amanita thiersii Skay4041]|uniref:Pheromone receptor n=1 Tax=Amanita thiersii Skay4041 TaxID=703135 RepID=A0A2A9NDZ1_9AGAR|nr:hypothetical protein AMATHDRAFT_148990 [Amanita thiersii Skay4041]
MSPSPETTQNVYLVFSFLSFFLCLTPLPWHIQAWNAGTCAFMIWTSISCLIRFVNALVWRGSVANVAPVWCDISSKLMVGASIGIPASILCISRRLYCITSTRNVTLGHKDRRRNLLIDLSIALCIPVLIMILHVIVQAHRFDILEDIGCYPVIYNTLPAYFLYFMWPILLGCISFIYSGLTLQSFWKKRAEFTTIATSHTAMSLSRYFRLMLLAFLDMMLTVPLGVYVIYISNKNVKLAPWVSWEDTHYDFGRVVQIPSMIWRSDASFRTSVELTRWLPVVCALIFFALFGISPEARKNYGMLSASIHKRISVMKGSIGILPSSKGLFSRAKWSHSWGSRLRIRFQKKQ